MAVRVQLAAIHYHATESSRQDEHESGDILLHTQKYHSDCQLAVLWRQQRQIAVLCL